MAITEPKVSCSIEFDSAGKHHGYLSVPHSRNDSGWGALHVPISMIGNGEGPTLGFSGGNHGDEYEGPIAQMKLIQRLQPDDIQGRVIVIPCLNYPAVMSGDRVSPIDGVNMNRAFPGRRDGSVSEMIAHFVYSKIIPLCDGWLDIHSGGKTMMFSPFVAYHRLEDRELTEKARLAATAAGGPISLELVELDSDGMLDTAVENAGKIFVGTELGGGGTTSTETVAVAEDTVMNLLAHFGLTENPPVTREARGLAPTRHMHMPDPDCFTISEDAGRWEALTDLDAPVSKGQALGQIHFPQQPQTDPVVYTSRIDGTLIGRSHKVLVSPGDFLGLVALDL